MRNTTPGRRHHVIFFSCLQVFLSFIMFAYPINNMFGLVSLVCPWLQNFILDRFFFLVVVADEKKKVRREPAGGRLHVC